MSGPVHAVASAPVGGVKAAGVSSGPTTSLMPDALPLTGPGIDDALGLLYAAMSAQRQQGLTDGGARVKQSEGEQRHALDAEHEAFRKRAENAADNGRGFFGSLAHLAGDVVTDVARGRPDQALKDAGHDVSDAVHSPAFWNDLEKGALWVAKVSAVVGSVAAAAATAGAAGIVVAGAAALVTAGGEVVEKTRCFGKLSDDIGIGMELAGGVAGAGVGFLPAASVVGNALRTAGLVCDATSAGTIALAGAAHVENAGFAANAANAMADATQADHHLTEMQQVDRWVVDDMKTQDKTRQRTMQSAQDAIKDGDQAHAAAAAGTATVLLRG